MSQDDEVFIFATSSAQRRLWLLDRLNPGNPAYNVPAVVRCRGPLDVDAVERAVNAVIARHETLRTNILLIDDEPKQLVAVRRSIAVRIVTIEPCGGLEPYDIEAVAGHIDAEVLRPFDLAAGALIRVVVYRLRADDHFVQITLHHIVADGWSMRLLVRDLGDAYQATVRGDEPSFPTLAIQYGDFAEWQREWLGGELRERHLAYWRRQLAAPLAVLELPTDRPRPSVQTYRGASLHFTVDDETAARLQSVARAESATLFMVLVAAFTALLFRYTRQEDVIVGSPIANRGRVELEPLIGCFVNTVVLRSHVQGYVSFRALLGGIRETTLDAYAHQDLPFEDLVDALQPERSMSYTPLFQLFFALQNTPTPVTSMEDVAVAPVELAALTAKFDLSVSLTEMAGGLRGAIEFSADLFDRATIERFAAHYRATLDAISREPDLPIDRIPLLSAGERRQIETWNSSTVEFPPPFTIHEAIERQAAATPDRVALRVEGVPLSYADLNGRANRIAHMLRRRGVGRETIVAVALDRSFDLVASLLAVMKAGGAYLPLDPGYPVERLQMMIADAGVRHIVTARATADTVQFDRRLSLCLDDMDTAIADESAENPAAGVVEDNAAYVMFTSGSTGRPKGAVNTHRGVLNRLRWLQQVFTLTDNDRVLQKTPFSFDVSVPELFTPLMVGACLVVARPEGHKDPAYLADVIDREAITFATFVPAMLRAFLEARHGSKHPSLRQVFSAGEALPADLPELFFARCDAALANVYGPTEAAIDVTCWHCRRDWALPFVPIGYPIANATIHIVDDEFAPTPIGVAGELLIGGTPVARGYLNRPDVTAERFVPDPFGPPGARLYRTGDRARRLADGAIVFLGRSDFQIKIRGHRVEAGEIEVRLRERAEIADAVVVAHTVPTGDVRLVAYVAPVPGATVDVPALRAYLAGALPSYMVPSVFVSIPALPLLPNGKVNRPALPPPTVSGDGERVPPRTETEEILAGIWRELLAGGPVGVHDNFFTLGGHSLLATQVISRIVSVFRLDVPLRAVFEHPTIATLAVAIEEYRRESGGVSIPPLERVPRDQRLSLSFAQQRFWFLNWLGGASAAYNMPAALRVDGPVDVATLERTLLEVMHRHEALRSRFVLDGAAPVVMIDQEPALRLEVTDLRALPVDERQAAVGESAAAEFDRAFNLAEGPLVRARLLVVGDESNVLLLTTHHIVSDGWSTNLLIADFVRIYAAFAAGRPSPLEPLPVQYVDFAAWQRRWLDGPALERQRAFWKQQLAGAPALTVLPPDRRRPPVQSFNGDSCTFALGSELAAAIKSLNERARSTTFITMLAAFFVLLSRWTHTTDMVIGSPTAGRSRKELEPVVGCFLNLLVLRADVSGDPTFIALIDRIRHVTLDAYAHQDLPFEQVVDAAETIRSTSVTPLFQIVFSAAMSDPSPIVVPGLRVEPLPPARVAAKFDLTVGIGESGGDITGAFEFNTDLFDRDTIVRLAADYRAIVTAATSQPEARLSTIVRLEAEEERRLVVLGTGAPATRQPVALLERVARWAERKGGAPAIVGPDGALSWRSLAKRSDALARRLATAGAGRGSRVGVFLPRSADAIIAALAVMKCGAAFVPLDPSYPTDRLRFMVENSGARLLAASAAAPIEIDGAQVIPIDSVPGDDDTPLTTDVGPEDLAYVIYTSGSTGRPKGVEVSHGALLNLVDWHLDAFAVGEGDRMSQIASVAFDASVWETWTALAAGAELHIPDDAMVKSPTALVAWLKDRRATISFVPTPLAEQIIDADWRGAALRVLLTGGDRLHRPAPANAPFTFVNNYGPTENAVVSTSGAVDAPSDGRLPSLGRPIAGTRVLIVDQHLQVVPAGVAGEILVGGASLARGYVGEPALTAERFIPDPVASESGARLYRTGDLGRWRGDGTLEFLGRLDRQVKIRGFRIELGEVEAVLASHPAVSSSTATLHGEADDEAAIVAYAVPRGPIDAAALRAFLRERLPEHMVPSSIVLLDHLPVTANGKLDVRALPPPLRDTAASIERAVPRDERERLIAGIWKDVLEVEVGIHENFFDVGGHSLKLIDVHTRLQQALARAPSIIELFQYPTVATLAARLEVLAAGAANDHADSVLAAAAARGAQQSAAWQRTALRTGHRAT